MFWCTSLIVISRVRTPFYTYPKNLISTKVSSWTKSEWFVVCDVQYCIRAIRYRLAIVLPIYEVATLNAARRTTAFGLGFVRLALPCVVEVALQTSIQRRGTNLTRTIAPRTDKFTLLVQGFYLPRRYKCSALLNPHMNCKSYLCAG